MIHAPPGTLFLGLIAAATSSLIWAVILKIAARWAASTEVPYGTAYFIVFIVYIINLLILILVGPIVGLWSGPPSRTLLLELIYLPVYFLVQTIVIHWRLYVSPGRALFISLVTILIGIGTGIILSLVVFGLTLIF